MWRGNISVKDELPAKIKKIVKNIVIFKIKKEVYHANKNGTLKIIQMTSEMFKMHIQLEVNLVLTNILY